jgi:tetrapyrrole methylase family protein/MazG family protein
MRSKLSIISLLGYIEESNHLVDQYEKEFSNLVEIIARLRGKNGCPWDRKQTHSSLREFLLEETYEVLESLDESDNQKLCQELGDLLLQIVLHTQIASENGEFDLEGVIKNINSKLIRRHPHVFGDAKVKSAEEVSHNWEAIKKNERNAETSILDSVPRQMPALAYSQDIQRRAAQTGFDWENVDEVIDKLVEEVKEFQQSVSQQEKSDEFGDLFFTLVNVARRIGIDPESSLRRANRKFYERFSFMEGLCRERGLKLGQLSFDQQNSLWEEAKIYIGRKNMV